jgi:GGDEF domain-containing protein
LRGHQAYQSVESESATDPHQVPVDDVASILDVASGGLPAPVQAAITALTGEIERLRADLDHARRHATLLVDQADHHSFLPTLNQRAFHREIARLMSQSERVGLSGSVIIVHVSGIEAVCEGIGLAAAETLLSHAAGTIRGEIEELDPLGYLDCGVFVIGLAARGDDEAKAHARRIEERLRASRCQWNGQNLTFGVATGIAVFCPDEDVRHLIETADAASRQQRT